MFSLLLGADTLLLYVDTYMNTNAHTLSNSYIGHRFSFSTTIKRKREREREKASERAVEREEDEVQQQTYSTHCRSVDDCIYDYTRPTHVLLFILTSIQARNHTEQFHFQR